MGIFVFQTPEGLGWVTAAFEGDEPVGVAGDFLHVEDPALIERIKADQPYARFENGEVVFDSPEEIAARLLAEARAEIEPAIDAAATQARHRFISPYKDATYTAKAAELDRWVKDGRPELAEGLYPYIEAEAEALGWTLTETAESIEQARGLWLQVDARIEAAARAGKVAARAATTAEACREAVQTCLSSLNGIQPETVA